VELAGGEVIGALVPNVLAERRRRTVAMPRLGRRQRADQRGRFRGRPVSIAQRRPIDAVQSGERRQRRHGIGMLVKGDKFVDGHSAFLGLRRFDAAFFSFSFSFAASRSDCVNRAQLLRSEKAKERRKESGVKPPHSKEAPSKA
jgi:hypothetical protein